MATLSITRVPLHDWVEVTDPVDHGQAAARLGIESLDAIAARGVAPGAVHALVVPNDVPAHTLAPALEHLDAIFLTFPKFSDGRAYSQARRLREELHYTGALWATGDILVDQARAMARCGFDVLELPDRVDVERVRRALDEPRVAYQPNARDEPIAARQRHPGTSR